jgi:hypothetical protein
VRECRRCVMSMSNNAARLKQKKQEDDKVNAVASDDPRKLRRMLRSQTSPIIVKSSEKFVRKGVKVNGILWCQFFRRSICFCSEFRTSSSDRYSQLIFFQFSLQLTISVVSPSPDQKRPGREGPELHLHINFDTLSHSHFSIKKSRHFLHKFCTDRVTSPWTMALPVNAKVSCSV